MAAARKTARKKMYIPKIRTSTRDIRRLSVEP